MKTITFENAMKLAGLLIGLGVLLSRINTIDARVERIEKFLDNHTVVAVKNN